MMRASRPRHCMDGWRKLPSPSRHNSQPAMSPMYGPLNAIWVRPIPTGCWWRLRVTCLRKAWARFFLTLLCAAVVGCTAPPPQPAGLRLTRTKFASLPEWNAPAAALTSFQRSCALLMAKPDEAPLTGAGYGGTMADWRGACANAASYADKG